MFSSRRAHAGTMKTALSIGTLFCFVSYRAASAGAFVAPGHAAAGWTKRAEIAIVSAAASRERSDEGDGAAWATGCNSRRSTVERLARSTCATAGAALAFFASGSPLPPAAWASGGATAGGAYLLSAKQRYNERVKAGAAGFLRLEKSLKENDVEALRSYFSGADDAPSGTWKDLTAAGYLLANAFRRNSAAAPDTLPSVQKWKAFASQVEGMTKALKKKDSAGALDAYRRAVAALDEYLEKVELSSSSL